MLETGDGVVVLRKNSDPNFLGAFLPCFFLWFFCALRMFDLTLGTCFFSDVSSVLNVCRDVGSVVVVVVVVVVTGVGETGLKVETWTGSKMDRVGADMVGLNSRVLEMDRGLAEVEMTGGGVLGVNAVVAMGSRRDTGSGLFLGGNLVKPLSKKGETLWPPEETVGKLGKLLVLTISSLGLLSDWGLMGLRFGRLNLREGGGELGWDSGVLLNMVSGSAVVVGENRFGGLLLG